MSANGPWKYFNCQWCCCEWRTFSGKPLSLCTYFPVSYPLDSGTAGQVLCASSSASFYHSSLKIAAYPLSIGDTLILLRWESLGYQQSYQFLFHWFETVWGTRMLEFGWLNLTHWQLMPASWETVLVTLSTDFVIWPGDCDSSQAGSGCKEWGRARPLACL